MHRHNFIAIRHIEKITINTGIAKFFQNLFLFYQIIFQTKKIIIFAFYSVVLYTSFTIIQKITHWKVVLRIIIYLFEFRICNYCSPKKGRKGFGCKNNCLRDSVVQKFVERWYTLEKQRINKQLSSLKRQALQLLTRGGKKLNFGISFSDN